MPPIMAPVVQPLKVGNRWEPLYERFRRQHPPKIEGGPNPLKVEEWMSMMTSILDFMRVVGNERVACASYMFREDARIWWDVVV